MNLSLFIFSCFALFSLGLLDNSRGPIYSEILQYFQITKSSGSLIFSLASFSAFISAIFASKWLRRFGAEGSTKIALFCHALAFLLMGISPASSLGFFFFLTASFIFGIGMGVLSITLNIMVGTAASPLVRRRILSGLHSMYGVASLLAPFLVGKLVGSDLDWQIYLMLLSALPLLIIMSKWGNSLDSKSEENDCRPKKSFGGERTFGILFSVYISGEILVGSRLVVYLKEIKNIGHVESNHYLSLFFLFLLIGRVLFAVRKFELSSKSLLSISASMSIISLWLGIAFDPFFLSFSGFGMSFFFPCAMDWLSEIYKEQVNLVISKVFVISGGFLVFTHWIFGFMANQIGLELTFWVAPILHMAVLYILQFHFSFLVKSN